MILSFTESGRGIHRGGGVPERGKRGMREEEFIASFGKFTVDASFRGKKA